jgi:hypothetical protein
LNDVGLRGTARDASERRVVSSPESMPDLKVLPWGTCVDLEARMPHKFVITPTESGEQEMRLAALAFLAFPT